MSEKLITYTFCAMICSGYAAGNFSVQAANYDEACNKAMDVLGESLKNLPGTVNVGFDVELKSTNADEIFTKELNKALYQYSEDNIDIVYFDEDNCVHVIYHSDNNSFSVFSIDADDFTIEYPSLGEYLERLADKYGCGHQNLDAID